MSREDLINIKGGINSTVYNTVLRVISTTLELGRTVGSIIRRALEKSVC